MASIFGASARGAAPWKVADASWVRPLRAERDKEPRLERPLRRTEVKSETPRAPSPPVVVVKVTSPRKRCGKELSKVQPPLPPKAELREEAASLATE
ncbi:unnamed protein product, partial [Effrenium voratum]